MSDQIRKHVIAVLIDNEFGALARVVELFSARGYNIETLTVAPVSRDKKMSRITITTFGSDKTIELICKLLRRIVPVHAAADLSASQDYIERELTLAQIIGDEENRDKAIKMLEKHRANVIEISGNSTVFEIIGTSQIVEEALQMLENYGLTTVSRTGIAAGFKGEKRLDKVGE
jgi:acetolactate synthase-1/3 small subunit